MAIPCWRQSPPLLTFEAPTAAVILPKSQAMDRLLNVQGQQVADNLPVYVKIVFVPRPCKVTLSNCADQVAQPLSIYRISPDDIIVYDGAQSYEQDQDYTLDLSNGNSNFVPRAALAGKTVHVQVTEYFPGYQCSINNMDWSPSVMFDATTPFPDVRKNYFPIEITADGWFPVVDELGSPLGIQIQPVPGNIYYEALLRIEVVASSSFGVTGTLEVEFDRPGYYNGLRLSPFVNMPVVLTRIRVEGVLAMGALPIFEGNVLLDRPVSLRFAGTDAAGKSVPIYVRRLYLDLYQPGYSLKQHLVNPADQTRQDAMARLQTVLPFSDRAVQGAVPTSLVGAQYEFGLRDIAGERYNPAGPGVFVSGPFHLDGMPEILRLDADITGDVDCYLIIRPQGIPVTTVRVVKAPFVPGTAFSFPDVWTAGALTGADFYLKWVFRSDDAVLTRFLLQVTKASGSVSTGGSGGSGDSGGSALTPVVEFNVTYLLSEPPTDGFPLDLPAGSGYNLGTQRSLETPTWLAYSYRGSLDHMSVFVRVDISTLGLGVHIGTIFIKTIEGRPIINYVVTVTIVE